MVLKIYVNTHDPQNNTRYYKWDYEETWEFHSAYLSILDYFKDPSTNQVIGVTFRDPFAHLADTAIYKCWQSNISRNINIGTSEKLNADIIYLPLLSIEPASKKLSVRYSIIVRQFALSHEAYLFYEKIKKNTEQLGSIFDPQPSELQGNIHCITDPKETVVGFVDVSEEKDLRIFISNDEVPGWNYTNNCEQIIIGNDPDSISITWTRYLPTIPEKLQLGIKTFYAGPDPVLTVL